MLWFTALIALAAPPKTEAPVPHSPGLHELTLQVDGVERLYTVYLPEGDGPKPVVLALHYAGHGAPHYATGYVGQLVAPALSELGAIVVAPDCPGRSWQDPVSETVALAVLDRAIAEWGGQRDRVVLTGFSMGGRGVWSLAAHHPERFSVIVPIAGDPGGFVEPIATAALPVYAIGGLQDTVVPQKPTEEAISRLSALGRTARWVPVDLSHFETARYAPALRAAVPWITARWAPPN